MSSSILLTIYLTGIVWTWIIDTMMGQKDLLMRALVSLTWPAFWAYFVFRMWVQ